MVQANLGNITFVEFVTSQHLDLLVEARGKEEIAKGAVEVLTRMGHGWKRWNKPRDGNKMQLDSARNCSL